MTQFFINLIVFSLLSTFFYYSFKEKTYWWEEGKFYAFLLFIFVFLELATGFELFKVFF